MLGDDRIPLSLEDIAYLRAMHAQQTNRLRDMPTTEAALAVVGEITVAHQGIPDLLDVIEYLLTHWEPRR